MILKGLVGREKKMIFVVVVATSPIDPQRTAVNSPASVQDNYEAMTPTQASMNQQQIATTNFNSKQKTASLFNT